MNRIIGLIVLLLAGLGPAGCFSFAGPSDIARQLEADAPLALEKEMGITVGPLGVALASAIAGPHLPMSLDGLSSVDFGEYTVHELSAEPVDVPLHGLEAKGWERVARIRDERSHVSILTWGTEEKVRRMLVLSRDGDELHIVRVTGNFEKLLDNLADSDLLDELPDFCGDGGGVCADDDDACDWFDDVELEHVEGCPSCAGGFGDHVDVHVEIHVEDDDEEVADAEAKPARVVTWE